MSFIDDLLDSTKPINLTFKFDPDAKPPAPSTYFSLLDIMVEMERQQVDELVMPEGTELIMLNGEMLEKPIPYGTVSKQNDRLHLRS